MSRWSPAGPSGPRRNDLDRAEHRPILGGAEAGVACQAASRPGAPSRSPPVACVPGRDLYVSVLVVYEVNNLLAGVDMTERVAGARMHEKMG